MQSEKQTRLDACDFLPSGEETVAFGISSDNPTAIKALRDLADGMERGQVVMHSAQVGANTTAGEMQKHVVFLEYSFRPW